MPPHFALLTIILVGVVLVSLMLVRFRQSVLIGYFLCGVAIANSGVLELFGGDTMEVQLAHMADFGVVLLMFTLGLEFSIGELRFLRRAAFGAGPLQMACTLIPVAVFAHLGGLSWPAAITLGVALAVSSTAVGLKVFQDLGIGGSSGARLALGIAIFQDLFIIAFAVLLPLLYSAGRTEGLLVPRVLVLAGKSLLFVGMAAALGRWVIPRLLQSVARSRSRELFTLSVFGMCVGIAFLGGWLELSLALGAFVAGVTVSESIFRHRILTEVRPLKDLFLTLFFVSVGLGVDLNVVAGRWPQVLGLTLALMGGKSVLTAVIARRLGWSWRGSLLAGAALSSAGEFSLVLMQKAAGLAPWPAAAEQVWVASIALSMALVPLAVRQADWIAAWVQRRGWTRPRPTADPAAKPSERLRILADHAIVCGYGPVGERVVAALDEIGVPSVVVELNADTVRTLHRAGRPVLFADATHHETWELAGVERARLVAFTFADAPVVAAALPLVRERRRDIIILARTKFAADVARLRQLGVDGVVNDEAEAGSSLVRESLAAYEFKI